MRSARWASRWSTTAPRCGCATTARATRPSARRAAGASRRPTTTPATSTASRNRCRSPLAVIARGWARLDRQPVEHAHRRPRLQRRGRSRRATSSGLAIFGASPSWLVNARHPRPTPYSVDLGGQLADPAGGRLGVLRSDRRRPAPGARPSFRPGHFPRRPRQRGFPPEAKARPHRAGLGGGHPAIRPPVRGRFALWRHGGLGDDLSSLATAGGTLVLAVATFASVRSSNRSMELAQRALELGLRPLLMPSRLEDPSQKIQWGDHHWAHVDGGCASVEIAENGNVYMAMSVRNAGTGIAVLRAWLVDPHPQPGMTEHSALDRFRPHIRDLYIPAGDIGFWQAALRDPADAVYPRMVEAIQGPQWDPAANRAPATREADTKRQRVLDRAGRRREVALRGRPALEPGWRGPVAKRASTSAGAGHRCPGRTPLILYRPS